MNVKEINKFMYESPDGLRYWFEGRVTSHNNLGLTSLKFIEDYGPNQHGSTVRDWRMNARTITLEIFLQGDTCCGTRGEQLAELINIIRPNRGTTDDVNGWLRFLNDSNILVEIPVFVLQGPSGDFDYGGNVGKYQVLDSVQFYAFDPIWREYEKIVINVDLETDLISCLDNCLDYSGSTTLSGFCLVPTSYVNLEVDINYTGTWDADQIDIKLVGPMKNPIISNETTGKEIELEYDIPAGDYVIIRLRPEFVTVLDNNGNNLIGSITSISDLVDFVLKSPGSITPTGLNDLRVIAVESDVLQTQIEISYWTRHISAYGSPQCN